MPSLTDNTMYPLSNQEVRRIRKSSLRETAKLYSSFPEIQQSRTRQATPRHRTEGMRRENRTCPLRPFPLLLLLLPLFTLHHLGHKPSGSDEFDVRGLLRAIPGPHGPLDLRHKHPLFRGQIRLLLLHTAQGSQPGGRRGCFHRWPRQRDLAIDGAPKRGTPAAHVTDRDCRLRPSHLRQRCRPLSRRRSHLFRWDDVRFVDLLLLDCCAVRLLCP